MPQVYSDESKVNAKQNLPVKMVKKAEGQEKEIWKPIEGYEGIYEVSSFGRIKSLSRIRKNGSGSYFWKEKIRKLSNPDGYSTICLSKNGKDSSFLVHRLVTVTFFGICPKGKSVNHKDFVRNNNHISNLEYLTPKENSQHALNGGRYHQR